MMRKIVDEAIHFLRIYFFLVGLYVIIGTFRVMVL